MALIGKQNALVSVLEANSVGATELVGNAVTAAAIAANAVGSSEISVSVKSQQRPNLSFDQISKMQQRNFLVPKSAFWIFNCLSSTFLMIRFII